MTHDFKVTGEDRKRLVKVVSDFLGIKAKYMFLPTYAYEIGEYNVSKEGVLTGPDNEELLQAIKAAGFTFEEEDQPAPAKAEATEVSDSLSISMPKAMLTGAAIENLKALIQAKGTLMKRAFQAESLEIEIDDEKVTFPWFSATDPEEVAAYTTFIQKICEMAVNQTRISAKEKEVVNEKYEFRCFLLRLGMIGNDTKKARKLLMQHLSGSAAFKSVAKKGGEQE